MQTSTAPRKGSPSASFIRSASFAAKWNRAKQRLISLPPPLGCAQIDVEVDTGDRLAGSGGEWQRNPPNG